MIMGGSSSPSFSGSEEGGGAAVAPCPGRRCAVSGAGWAVEVSVSDVRSASSSLLGETNAVDSMFGFSRSPGSGDCGSRLAAFTAGACSGSIVPSWATVSGNPESSASFLLGFELAPDHAMGQYQGLYGMGMGLSTMLGPPLIALLPLGMGVPGWWLLGGILLTAGLLTKPAVAWCERTRPRYDAPVPAG